MNVIKEKILLITPPFTQLNTPYPATTYLKGFLNTLEVSSFQADLGLEVILRLFSEHALNSVFDIALSKLDTLSANAQRIVRLRADYLCTIEPVIDFLQNRNPTLAHSICDGNLLPEASRFEQLDDLEWAFGTMGTRDKARHLATLYLEDISDLIIEAVDAHFGFSRYAESLSISASTFDALEDALNSELTLVDKLTTEILNQKVVMYSPSVVAITVPFPGNLYAALRCGEWLKKHYPTIKVIMGGGYPNTELRSISDPRIFKYIDFITLDDGEVPITHLLEHFSGQRDLPQLTRTFMLKNGNVVYCNGSKSKDLPQSKVGTPDYTDLLLNSYLSVIEVANPMHRMWSDGRWNKLTLAHGCYWGKCTFCDTSLDYIKRYEPNAARLICDRIEAIIVQTGETGFHFVDEAAPPALMKEVALEILHRGLTVVWWTNIRFEKSFTYDLCRLLKKSGCVAVSGGLEVASDRLLRLIDKGVTVEQVACVADNFSRAGIMTHAYLMFGFPTQTAQETIDSLEVVRQMFELGIVQSGFWHRFAMTAHSPVGLDPKAFNVQIENASAGSFANNEVGFIDPVGTDHGAFSHGLRTSLFNYMHGVGFDIPLKQWFDFRVPRTKISPNLIEIALETNASSNVRPTSKIIWIGGQALLLPRNKLNPEQQLIIDNKKERIVILGSNAEAEWLLNLLPKISVRIGKPISYSELIKDYQANIHPDFDSFWNGSNMQLLRNNGFLVI